MLIIKNVSNIKKRWNGFYQYGKLDVEIYTDF